MVECRRYTTSKLKQEHLAAVAYRIIDTEAKGGIVVSPLEFQEGAKKMAGAEGIIEATLNPDCTRYEYVLGFLNKLMIGLYDEVPPPKDSVSVEILYEDGTRERRDLA